MYENSVLTEEMIAWGRELIGLLDKARFAVDSALWIYNGEQNVWRLVIASPEVRIIGPRQSYKKVQSVLSRISANKDSISLSNLSIVDSTDPLISLLRKAIKTGPAISGIRFSGNTINGVFIEDAYIYRNK